MHIGRRFFIKASFFLSIALILLTSLAANAQTCTYWVGKAVSVQGNVETMRAGETVWRPVKFKDTFCPGDMLRVLERSRADIVLVNETILRLDQNTTIIFSKPQKETTFFLDLISGIAHFFSRFRRSLTVATPFVNASVEGTEFLVKVGGNKSEVIVFEGYVIAANSAGSISLIAGQSAEAEGGKAPVARLLVRPLDAVQWMLYYPPVVYHRPSEFEAAPSVEWQEKVQESMEFYRKGDLRNAFAAIAEDVRDPRFFVYRASLLLSVGRVEEAKADIEKALSLAPPDGQAYALQSIIALTQNEKEKALMLAESAVKNAPDSAAPRIALSYALQAGFDLKGALSSLEDAVQAEPGNALAWARLAEVQLSFGEIGKALDAAKKAETLDPDIARTNTVLGFVYLARTETRLAKEEFEKAIELDQADPLPRLGLGLAKIREGDLSGGREEIEIAVSLDPENALLRSYLGKAYYEEKRDEQASKQFEKAKELDPLDPTSFFYDAVRKQSINRPVEALHDMQESIELNDSRAVYRSRLLLDEDLASRSAGIARVYSDLGFQQLALVEGWKSVNTDPTSYSAHRFLADSYSALPNHEIARVSELLQSQLLQPVNIVPVQPSLTESDLFILDGAGPGSPSFNEFNQLFYRNRFALQLSGVAGGNNTMGDELLVSGLKDRFSFSVGQFHYETDGFRKNNDLEQDIFNVFAQLDLSYKTSIQAEFRTNRSDKGDLPLRFDPENFSPDFRQEEESDSIRLGFRHSFAPGNDLIVNFIYKDLDASTHVSLFTANDTAIKEDEEGYLSEIQHLYRSERINLTSGVGYYDSDYTTGTEVLPFFAEVSKTDVRHTNMYVYSNVKYPDNFTWTVGGSADFFDDDVSNRDQVNPKFGFTWNPISATTLRAAAFRVLKRSLLSNQTLEPTQVAGFNQFFDDANGTEAWRYGIALDQKFTRDLYAGLEISKRDLTVPFEKYQVSDGTLSSETADWEEHMSRAYLYWTPLKWLAAGAEYRYEHLKRDEKFPGGELFTDIKTHRLPLSIKVSHPSGLSAGLVATYINQEFEFIAPDFGGTESGSDSFWIMDGSISYRFPGRYGIFTIEGRNLFDKKFRFQDTDPSNPTVYPERVFFAKLTFAL